MEKRTPKSPAVVDSKHSGCMFGFSSLFDFHHGRPSQKLLLSFSHGNKTLTVAEKTRSKAENLISFDENHQRINKKHKKAKNVARNIVDQNPSQEMSLELSSHGNGFCNQIPLKLAKHSSSRTKHYHPDKNSLQIVPAFNDQTEVTKETREKSLWNRVLKSRHVYPSQGKKNLDPLKSLEILKPKQNFQKERASISSSGTNEENKDIRPMDLKLSIRPEKSANRYPKRRESDIFVEARKHLSERLRKVEMLEAVSGKQTPRTLEGILLSSPKHEFMDTLNSKWEKYDGSVSTQMRFSPYGNSQLAYERSLPTQKGKKTVKPEDFMLCNSSSRDYEKILETPQEQTSTNRTKIFKENRCSDGHRLESSFESQLSRFSPELSSSSTANICKLQIKSRDEDRGDNPSPVSILEPFFMDDVSSPTSTITESGEPPLRPLHLNFDEHPEISLSTETLDSQIISDYIKKVYQTSQLNWDEFLVKGCPSESSCDQKLLYDCVKEVLVDLHQWYFSSFLKSGIQTVPMEENLVNIVMKKAEWSTVPSTTSHTLGQLMRKDIAESGKWVDVRADTDNIVTEIAEEALEYEILETILDIQTIQSAYFKGLMLQL